MKTRTLFGYVAVVVVALVVLGASAHAAAGPEPHEGAECIACALCDWLNTLLN